MATIRLIPSTYYLSSSDYLSVSNASNMYNNTDNTTYATVTNSRNQTSSYYIYVRGFNFDAIPSTAVINSFTIKLKGNHSGGYSQVMYLYDGTSTSFGSSNASFSPTVTVHTFNPTKTWSEIVESGSDFGIRINCRRSSRNQTAYIYIYGAEIEVDYTIPIYHQITSVSNTDLVQSISPEGTTTIQEGDNYTLSVYADTFGDFIVEDNGADVTDQLVQREITDTGGTINAVALSDYDMEFSSNGAQFYASSDNSGPVNGVLAIGYTAESPNPNTPTSTGVSNYMYVKDSSGNGTATGSLVFNFDFSSIPENAVIESVSISAYGCQESASSSSSSETDVCKLGAYSGSTLKGSEQDITRTSNGITTMSNVGTCTRHGGTPCRSYTSAGRTTQGRREGRSSATPTGAGHSPCTSTVRRRRRPRRWTTSWSSHRWTSTEETWYV